MDFFTAEDFEDFITHIHDKIFKLFFQRTVVMLECLTGFCPPSVVDTLDLTNLKLKDTNFINKNLKEYFSDVIYETYLKDYPADLLPDESKIKQKNKKEAKVVLITEHKSSIESYFALFLQLITYKVQVLTQDLEEGREPSVVLAIIINNGTTPVSPKTFQDCYKFLPDALKEYMLQMKLIVVNVHEQKRETLLLMRENSLLRALFLTYQAVESDEEKEDVLMEIFKFMLANTNLKSLFQPILYYLIKQGGFQQEALDKTINHYLTPQQKEKMHLSLGDQWLAQGRAQGEILGEARGEARGKAEGKRAAARLVILKSHYRGIKSDMLVYVSELPPDEVQLLINGFNFIKKAWQKNPNVEIGRASCRERV